MKYILGVPHVVLLTKIDHVCHDVAEDTSLVFHSEDIHNTVTKIAGLLGMPRTLVLPVRNYETATELDNNIDILALTSLRHMLRLADDYFDEKYDTMCTGMNTIMVDTDE